jgi:signal transduction histidine kinase
MNLPSAMFAAIASNVEVRTGHVTPLLQMVKEALANVTNHACATQVNAELDYDKTDLKIRIQDDGRGFLLSRPNGHG